MALTTAPPVPTTPTSSSTMGLDLPLDRSLPAVMVHRALRRELRLAAPLVREVRAGDDARAAIVAEHLDFLLRSLEHHHQLEDDHLWPPLRERVPDATAPLIATMAQQHRRIEQLTQLVTRQLGPWAAAPDDATGEGLAHLLVELHATLTEHLDLEERAVLPLAELHLLPAEWDEIGRRAEASHAGPERTLAFGMLQYEGDPTVLALMLGQAPRLARLIVPIVARRAYRRHALVVHGTATPGVER